MTIVKSLSGIRGTIGGKDGNNLSPIDIIKFSYGYVSWIKKKYKNKKKNYLLILGRDGRLTSKMFYDILIIIFQMLEINVISIDLSTTPTVGLAIIEEKADGGIMITASHNSKKWNGLKFFNAFGEFLSKKDFEDFFVQIKKKSFYFSSQENFGKIFYKKNYIQKHVDKILSLPIVDINAIKRKKLRIVVDGINSTGGIAVPILLNRLGIKVIKIHCDLNKDFTHNPEPIKKNLKDICKKVPELNADLGISVDPDVDRVVFICNNGEFFGEEYTLLSIVDYVLKKELGPIVSTFSSSSIVLKKISKERGIPFYEAPVGEVHVVQKMKEVNAVIGGEGNGSIIYPKFRYGRDALIGVALFLTYFCKVQNRKNFLSDFKKRYPKFFVSKKKIKPSFNHNKFINFIKKKYKNRNINYEDGIKIYLNNNNEWIHVRKSNTEKLYRVYAESNSKKRANNLTKEIIDELKKIQNKKNE